MVDMQYSIDMECKWNHIGRHKFQGGKDFGSVS